jgi:ADP-heptose:LPS heptosyltransferase
MMKILVIRLGALGDFVLSFPAFAAIRANHPDARITLLTTAAFAGIGRAAPWFDEVRIDTRPRLWNPLGLWRTARALRGFDFVYDLQTSARSSRYFRLAGSPPWSGIASGCSHPHANLDRNRMHTIERQQDQLRAAGLRAFPAPERAWLAALGNRHNVPPPYALLVPGAAKDPRKRWPAERFGALAALLAGRGLTPVVIGGPQEQPAAAAIRALCPAAIDLTGMTSIPDLAALGEGAALAVGGDTGPMHVIASMGAPALALFSAAGIPAQAAPRGPDGGFAKILQAPSIEMLSLDQVAAALPAPRLARTPP